MIEGFGETFVPQIKMLGKRRYPNQSNFDYNSGVVRVAFSIFTMLNKVCLLFEGIVFDVV